MTEAVEADAAEFGPNAVSVGGALPELTRLRHRIRRHMEEIYGADSADGLTERLLNETQLNGFGPGEESRRNKWTEGDVFAITYGDTIRSDSSRPLEDLNRFMTHHLKDVVSGIHLLPFFPFSSDDGFSVVDYLKVNPEVGNWGDIKALGEHFKLMGDLVINHCSVKNQWFQNFLQGEEPGAHYFVEAEEGADYSSVVRPRATPLFTKFETEDGMKSVWCTFGPDQVDLDFSNPDVLFEMIRGAKVLCREWH